MSHEFKHPIIGQEAVTPHGLGRVVAFKDEFPFQWIAVKLYKDGVTPEYAPHNVKFVKVILEEE